METKGQIKTFIGTLEVQGVRKDSTGYWVIAGDRSWMVTAAEYQSYKANI